MYFRAFFGVPDTVRAPDGTPVNAVRGFLDFIAHLDQAAPARPTWSRAWTTTGARRSGSTAIPTYKTHRVAVPATNSRPAEEEVPDDLEIQVPIITDVLDALGIVHLGIDGHEADDVIGTLATRADGPVDVVTGDRDLFQLVDDERQRPGALHRQGHPQPGDRRRGGGDQEVRRSPGGPTPPSPACAATRATACRACPASGTRRPRRWSPPTATSRPSWPRPRTRSPSMSPAVRRKLREARRLPGGGAEGRRGGPRPAGAGLRLLPAGRPPATRRRCWPSPTGGAWRAR